ncbi:MAG: orotate phosphoribosyltransferase [Opitutales bacterium]
MTQEDKILNIFRETKALLEGHFILRSGLHSGHFFQCARVCERLEQVSELIEMLLAKLKANNVEFDTVLAPAMGGLVLGQELARQAKARFLFVEKVDNMLALRRNFKMEKGEKILIVEDVITRGGRVDECIKIIKDNGATPVACALLVDRSEGKANFEIDKYSLLEFSFPTYQADKLPPELESIPATHPGS